MVFCPDALAFIEGLDEQFLVDSQDEAVQGIRACRDGRTEGEQRLHNPDALFQRETVHSSGTRIINGFGYHILDIPEEIYSGGRRGFFSKADRI